MREYPTSADYENIRYRDFWVAGRDYENLAERTALSRLLPSQGGALVDIGAGFGRLADLYRGYQQVVLIDPARTQLAEARRALGESDRITLAAADIYRLPLADQAFDAAVTVRVLHHLRDVPQALVEVQRIIKPGGIFILEYANKRNLKEILRWLVGRSQKRPFSLEPVEFLPWHFNFHPAYIARTLQEAEFGVQRELAVSHFRLGVLKRLFPAQFLAALDSILMGPGAWLKLSPSVFVAARAVGVREAKNSSPRSSLFQCPYDRRGSLVPEGEVLTCPYCGRRWLPQDGIYDFRVPE